MTDRELMQMALGAVNDLVNGWKYIRESYGDLYGVGWERAEGKGEEALQALRDRLAQPEQEPVAKYSDVISDGGFDPRYTAPPKREWVGLTDADIANLRYSGAQPEREWVGLTKAEFEEAVDGLEDLEDCWMMIEARLREKNK